MTKRLITYELSQPEQNYERLHKAIKSLGEWIHPMRSVWFVDTSKPNADIRDELKAHLDDDDSLFVSTVNGWASWNMDDAEWVKS